jgi:hypothetical protein
VQILQETDLCRILYKVRDHTAIGRGQVSREIYQGMVSVLQNWKRENEETTIAEFLISNFRRVLNLVYFLLGISPASD